MESTAMEEQSDIRHKDGGSLSVFQVMPRNMHFGTSRATSIDLCVRDLVAASRYRQTTRILAEPAVDLFPGFSIEPLPAQSRTATFSRANQVARAARRDAPDIIIVQQHLPTAAAIARRLPQAKVILHTHNFQKGYETGGVKQLIHRAMRKRRYALLAGIIHVSRACAERFAEAWPDIGLPGAVVNNGLEFESWRPTTERAREVLYVGRCAPEKGAIEAAEGVAAALTQCPGWSTRFILSDVGVHPDYFSRVQTALSSLGPRAGIEVQCPFAEVKSAFERAAVAIVPSKWIEPFGRTALEAHAGGAALISSGTGGLREISGDAALMLPEVTNGAIAQAAHRLMADEALRGRLAYEGAQRVRALFDIGVQAAQLDGFCLAIAHRNK